MLLRKYTAVDGALKNKIITAMEKVFLYQLVDYITGFGHVYTLTMQHHLLLSYRTIEEIYLEENPVMMMGTYNPA